MSSHRLCKGEQGEDGRCLKDRETKVGGISEKTFTGEVIRCGGFALASLKNHGIGTRSLQEGGR